MSQIFDALHQAATERVGNGGREFAAVQELLQVVERKAASATLDAEPSVQAPVRESPGKFPSVEVVLSQHSKLVCIADPESLAAEKFRFLATRLRHLQQKRALKRLVITSSVMGEGKSIVAVNLAYALAAGQQQVLLVEGDLRRPSLGRELGLQELPGLSQLLRDPSDRRSNVYCLKGSELCVLLAGETHTNPMEFMEAPKLASLIDRVSSGFDWVVIDSPPILPLADTSIWMRMAEGVLLVTRPGVTSKRQLLQSLETLEQSKVLGAVLNASNETSTNHYYRHYVTRGGGLSIAGPAGS